MTSPIEEDGRHGNPLTMTKCGCRVAGSQGADLDDTPENHGLWICLWLPGVVTERSRQINGPIADRAGAVVPNVAVEIRNAETGAVYQAGRRRRETIVLAQLPAGQYELSANVPGFKKFARQNVAVEVGQTYLVDVVPELGSNTESVTVNASLHC